MRTFLYGESAVTVRKDECRYSFRNRCVNAGFIPELSGFLSLSFSFELFVIHLKMPPWNEGNYINDIILHHL